MNKTILIVIPLIVGIGVGIFLVNYNDQANPKTAEPAKFTVSSLKAGGSPVMGNPNASITILEYGDYQCTFCYRFHQITLNTLQEKYVDTGKVNLIFKDFTLNGPDSILAAEASYCANDQGKYWEYHDELYENWAGERTGWITRITLDEFAQTVGLETEQFNKCLDQQEYREIVLEMYKTGQEIGIDATPSFLIFNSEKVIKIRGNQPLEVFEKTIDGL